VLYKAYVRLYTQTLDYTRKSSINRDWN